MTKHIVRTPETHPLTWRLRDDKQPLWLDEYRSKTAMPAQKRPSKAWPRTDRQPGERLRAEGTRRRGLLHRFEVEPDAEGRIHEHPLPAV